MVIDTHCHIHDDTFYPDDDRDEIYQQSVEAKIQKMICVGTDAKSSQQAVDFCQDKPFAFPTVALHPHDASHSEQEMQVVAQLASDHKNNKIVAIGEFGLDYYYGHSSKKSQQQVLIEHFELTKRLSLPAIFHIRGSKQDPNDAFVDFFEVYDKYQVPGVVHSFSAFEPQLQAVLDRDLFVGINGIITFTSDDSQLATMLSVPLEKLLLETDSPFLTPKPFRGTMNTPKQTLEIAKFIAKNSNNDLSTIAKATTDNACKLFKLN